MILLHEDTLGEAIARWDLGLVCELILLWLQSCWLLWLWNSLWYFGLHVVFLLIDDLWLLDIRHNVWRLVDYLWWLLNDFLDWNLLFWFFFYRLYDFLRLYLLHLCFSDHSCKFLFLRHLPLMQHSNLILFPLLWLFDKLEDLIVVTHVTLVLSSNLVLWDLLLLSLSNAKSLNMTPELVHLFLTDLGHFLLKLHLLRLHLEFKAQFSDPCFQIWKFRLQALLSFLTLSNFLL